MSKFDKLDKNKLKKRLDVLDKGTSDRLEMIPIDKIFPNPHQPRVNFKINELEELSRSIQKDGLLQPIAVKKESDGNYRLISGERRLRATKMLKKTSIKAIILNNEELDLKILALIENTQRANLTPIEEAVSMREIMETKGISKQKLAELINKSYDHTVSLLSLTELPKEIQKELKEKPEEKISIQALQALSRIKDDKKAILLLKEIKEKKLNKKESMKLIQNTQKKESIKKDSQEKQKSESSNKNNEDNEVSYYKIEKINRKISRITIEIYDSKQEIKKIEDFLKKEKISKRN